MNYYNYCNKFINYYYNKDIHDWRRSCTSAYIPRDQKDQRNHLSHIFQQLIHQSPPFGYPKLHTSSQTDQSSKTKFVTNRHHVVQLNSKATDVKQPPPQLRPLN